MGRRAHQFADLTFVTISSEKLRFVTHTHIPTVHRKIREEPDGRKVGTVHVCTAVCLEKRDVYIQRFSDISVIDCKSVFEQLVAPTGIDDKRCAIEMAIIRGCLSRMAVPL